MANVIDNPGTSQNITPTTSGVTPLKITQTDAATAALHVVGNSASRSASLVVVEHLRNMTSTDGDVMFHVRSAEDNGNAVSARFDDANPDIELVAYGYATVSGQGKYEIAVPRADYGSDFATLSQDVSDTATSLPLTAGAPSSFVQDAVVWVGAERMRVTANAAGQTNVSVERNYGTNYSGKQTDHLSGRRAARSLEPGRGPDQRAQERQRRLRCDPARAPSR